MPHPQASDSLWKAVQQQKTSSFHLGSMASTRVPVTPGPGLGFPGTSLTDVTLEHGSGSSHKKMSHCPCPMWRFLKTPLCF